ncbi:Flagellar hook-length control protein fliK [Streptomyces misionensis JCM 4497]
MARRAGPRSRRAGRRSVPVGRPGRPGRRGGGAPAPVIGARRLYDLKHCTPPARRSPGVTR